MGYDRARYDSVYSDVMAKRNGFSRQTADISFKIAN
jgi:hypothetical protein